MQERAIERLIFEYARKIDAGDFPGVADMFRRGKICSAFGEPTVGYDAVLALYDSSTRLYEDGTPGTRHITTNLTISVDGPRARAQSYFTVMQSLPDFPLQAIISGSYDDEFERIENQWQFSCRTMYPALLGDLSRHLLFDTGKLSN
ncbi:MAG: nuclear transport factor 2 family protein [Halioglobus sp.]